MANDKYDPSVKVYSNKNGGNITWNKGDGNHASWHSNSESNKQFVYAEKYPNLGSYQKVYSEDGRVIKEVLKDEHGNIIWERKS